jgi:hypothetical protein
MEPLGDEVRRELRRFGPQGDIAGLVEAWPEAVGREIARNAWPARVQRDGTLVVHARDAIWAFELTQRAPEISARLPSAPPVKVVPGPLPELAAEPPGPVPARPQASVAQARQAADWASAIEDDRLRELVARAARASLAGTPTDRRV